MPTYIYERIGSRFDLINATENFGIRSSTDHIRVIEQQVQLFKDVRKNEYLFAWGVHVNPDGSEFFFVITTQKDILIYSGSDRITGVEFILKTHPKIWEWMSPKMADAIQEASAAIHMWRKRFSLDHLVSLFVGD